MKQRRVMDDWGGESQLEVAEALGVLPEAVRQVERRAIRRLWRMQVNPKAAVRWRRPIGWKP